MTQPADLALLAGKLTEAQKRLVIASDPDDITGRSGSGAPITGALYRTAKVLEWRHGLGTFSHGSPYGDLYFNNSLGLQLRTHLQENSNG